MKKSSLSIEETPKLVTEVTRISEDVNFYSHNGISIKSIVRAIFVNLKKGRIVQGGSTISQQLVKNLFLSHEKTFERKLKELFITFQVEKQFSKDEIMNLYLNNIYFGQGTIGLKASLRDSILIKS